MTGSYKPDIGTVIALDTGVSILGASAVSIEVKKPSGATVSWVGAVGADNQSVEYTILAGDLTESGTYKLQAKVVIGSGTWYGQTTDYSVKELWT
jgi:hypothetical protein